MMNPCTICTGFFHAIFLEKSPLSRLKTCSRPPSVPRAVVCGNLHLRASAHLWHVSAFSCNRKFRGISCYMKKAPSHEDAFISFPYLVKGGLSSLNETGS